MRKSLRIFAVSAFLMLGLNSHAQVFWTETFGGGGACGADDEVTSYVGPNGAWTMSNLMAMDPEANTWYVSAAEQCPGVGLCSVGCGGTNNKSLHVGSTTLGDMGASYDAGGLCPILWCTDTDRRAESPLINCSGKTGITLSFNYIEFGDGALDDGSVWYSANGGATWSLLINSAKTSCGTGAGCTATACTGTVQGKWTAFSIALPASADGNPNVKIGFRWVNNDDGVGTDPSYAIDDITLSTASTNTITTNAVSTTICACGTVSVPFSCTGTFTAGNIFTAQISNSTGSFATPTAIGTLSATAAGTYSISATIPCTLTSGTGYRIRVVSSAPAVTGTDNGANITINVPPAISTQPTNQTVCAPDLATFTVGATGTGLSYQWQVNTGSGFSDITGATSSTYVTTATTTGMSGWTYRVIVSGTCPTSLTSNVVTLTVNSCAGSITTGAAPLSICACDNFTLPFTSVGSYFGGNIYSAEISNAAGSFATPTTVGTLSSTSSGALNISVTIPCTLTSGTAYRIRVVASSPATTGTDNGFNITVNIPPSISAQPTSQVVCDPNTATFTVGAAGTGLGYQWQVNTGTGFSNIAGATSATYVTTATTTGMNGWTFRVIVTGTCPATLTSNVATLTVNSCTNTITTGTTIPTTLCGCGNINVPFTCTGTYTAGNVFTAEISDATGSFATPTAIGTLSATTLGTYTIPATIPCTLTSGTSYRIRVVSSAPAVTGTDNTLNITINQPPTITGQPANITVCAGDDAAFSLTAVGAGLSYQWQMNTGTGFNDIPGATASTYTATAVSGSMSGYTYRCIITGTCLPAATTTVVTLTVNSCVNTITTGSINLTVCAGSTINVPFTALGTYTAGNEFTAQLSDITGAFTSPVNLTPTLSSTATGAQTITGVFIPTTTAPGSNYRIRVVASAPSTIGTDNAVNITVTAPVTVTVNIAGTPTEICPNEEVKFKATPVNGGTVPTYKWFVNSKPVGTNKDEYTTTTIKNGDSVKVVLISTLTCVLNNPDTSNVIVANVKAGPTADAGPDQTIVAGSKVTLKGTGGGTYQWLPITKLSCNTCAEPVATPTKTISYTLTVTDNGCEDKDTVWVMVTYTEDIAIPSAFSPNGDGINDELFVRSNSIETMHFRIFNRWGEMVFETNDITQPWNGRFRGQDQNPGVYVYILDATLIGGKVVPRIQGNVTLVR